MHSQLINNNFGNKLHNIFLMEYNIYMSVWGSKYAQDLTFVKGNA
jgi:hypothetical protein